MIGNLAAVFPGLSETDVLLSQLDDSARRRLRPRIRWNSKSIEVAAARWEGLDGSLRSRVEPRDHAWCYVARREGLGPPTLRFEDRSKRKK